MKVAVASQDGVTISEHFGRSSCFIVFDVEDDEILGSELRQGTFEAHAVSECETRRCANNCGHDYSDMVAALAGCQVVICHGMGWHAASELVRGGINPMVIRGDLSPREAIEKYIEGGLEPAAGFCRITGRPAPPEDS